MDVGATAIMQPMAGQALQKVGGQYATAIAVQVPRDEDEAKIRLLADAEHACDSFFYSWTVKDKATGKRSVVEGPSIGLATAAHFRWKNCALEMQPVQDLGDSWVFTCFWIDLESGVTLPRQFRQSKAQNVGEGMGRERAMDMRFKIGQSKAIRNVIVNAIPDHVLDAAVARAKEGVKVRIGKAIEEGRRIEVVEHLVKRLAAYGVDLDRILLRFGRQDIDGLDLNDLVTLNGDVRAITDQHETPDVLFPTIVDAVPAPTKGRGTAVDAMKAKGRAAKKSPIVCDNVQSTKAAVSRPIADGPLPVTRPEGQAQREMTPAEMDAADAKQAGVEYPQGEIAKGGSI